MLAGIGTHAIVYSFIDGNGCISSDTSFIEVYDDLGIINSISSNWSIYPNPFNTGIYIDINEPVHISIVDMLGREIYFQKANDSVNISLSDLSKGIYHVHLSGLESERKQSIRLVKN